MDIINQFIAQYGTSILYTVLTAVLSFVGLKLKNIYERYTRDRIKKEVVNDTVKYIEQLYKDLDGTQKLEMAKDNILTILKEKAITISELELNVLIESACHCLKNKVGGEQ